MKISQSLFQPKNINSVYRGIPQLSFSHTDGFDMYEKSSNDTNDNSVFKKVLNAFFSLIVGVMDIIFKIFGREKYTVEPPKDFNSDRKVTDFTRDIAKGIKEVKGKDIPPEHLVNVLSPSQFKEFLPKFKEANFRSDRKNIKEGIYCADLDNQTAYTSGTKNNVFYLLNNVAGFADQYYEREHKDFIFSIADRDSLYGIQNAIAIMGENPEKYKHVLLVPAVKLTYSHRAPNSSIGFENSEMLVYGINPFSENIMDFIDNKHEKRNNMMKSFIDDIYTMLPEFSYSVPNFSEKNKIFYERDMNVSNLYWRLKEYAESKCDPDMYDTKNDAREVAKALLAKYSTHIDKNTGEIVSSAENLYGEIIDSFSKEKEKPCLALVAPYYLTDYFKQEDESDTMDSIVDFIKNQKAESKGMLLAFESVVPKYNLDKSLKQEQIDKFNDYLRAATSLYEVGGSFNRIENDVIV